MSCIRLISRKSAWRCDQTDLFLAAEINDIGAGGDSVRILLMGAANTRRVGSGSQSSLWRGALIVKGDDVGALLVAKTRLFEPRTRRVRARYRARACAGF